MQKYQHATTPTYLTEMQAARIAHEEPIREWLTCEILLQIVHQHKGNPKYTSQFIDKLMSDINDRISIYIKSLPNQ